jgi:hypothetical protein
VHKIAVDIAKLLHYCGSQINAEPKKTSIKNHKRLPCDTSNFLSAQLFFFRLQVSKRVVVLGVVHSVLSYDLQPKAADPFRANRRPFVDKLV